MTTILNVIKSLTYSRWLVFGWDNQNLNIELVSKSKVISSSHGSITLEEALFGCNNVALKPKVTLLKPLWSWESAQKQSFLI